MKIQTSGKTYRLNAAGYAILAYLNGVGVSTEDKICRALDQGHASQTVQGLERAGLVEKEANRYSLTEDGRHAYAKARNMGGISKTKHEKTIETRATQIGKLKELVRKNPDRAARLLVERASRIVLLKEGYPSGLNKASESKCEAIRKKVDKEIRSYLNSLRRY